MDKWKYYDITHKHHVLCNPTSYQKLDNFCKLLQLEPGSRVLDIACGKGEFLVRLAELYDISGVGVDLSPYVIKDFEEKKKTRVPNADLLILEMDGADYKPTNPFDVSVCLGASWVFNGYKGTLQALMEITKPGGLIISGEPYWIKEPEEEYLKIEGMKRDLFGTHYENVKLGQELGLNCIYTMVSNLDEWDVYETLQWYAVDEWIRLHPDDEDNSELRSTLNKTKDIYIRWGRNTLGWAIYIFRVPS